MYENSIRGYEKRHYRDRFKGVNLVFFDVCVCETDLRIGAHSNLYDIALRFVEEYRSQLESYIKMNPLFLSSLEPIDASSKAPEIVKQMCRAAKMAGVGPMAAVAGAISQSLGMELLKYSDEIIIENGGDIFMSTLVARKVGIYAGNSPLSEKLSIEVGPNDSPLGICTSSGTVGHSLSFGKADAALIVSRDVFLADAVATATGNLVKSAEDIEKALSFTAGIPGIEGALVIIGDKLGVQGNIKLCK